MSCSWDTIYADTIHQAMSRVWKRFPGAYLRGEEVGKKRDELVAEAFRRGHVEMKSREFLTAKIQKSFTKNHKIRWTLKLWTHVLEGRKKNQIHEILEEENA